MEENPGILSQTSKEKERDRDKGERNYFRGLGRGGSTGEVPDR